MTKKRRRAGGSDRPRASRGTDAGPRDLTRFENEVRSLREGRAAPDAKRRDVKAHISSTVGTINRNITTEKLHRPDGANVSVAGVPEKLGGRQPGLGLRMPAHGRHRENQSFETPLLR